MRLDYATLNRWSFRLSRNLIHIGRILLKSNALLNHGSGPILDLELSDCKHYGRFLRIGIGGYAWRWSWMPRFIHYPRCASHFCFGPMTISFGLR